ncbi:peptidoglycan-binding domain-containing protein [Kribbella sp. NPDC056951]|uniref:peptidoglycan-binding domain-containing protein n=1 Tax=Kribbella sp. NPDC056951 TaxID=3345978 RepID=UPI00362FE69C
MAFTLPKLPKFSGRTIAVLAVAGALGVGAVAAGASKQQQAAAPPKPADGQAAPLTADKANDQTSLEAAAAAEAKLVQCRSARLIPVNKTWGIPMPSVNGNSSTNCNLKYGDTPHRGSDRTGDPLTAIQVLQRNLNSCYGTKLTVDGIYGKNTRAVVTMVQRKHKIVVDGIYGPKTRSAMNWRLYSSATRSWSKTCSSPL